MRINDDQSALFALRQANSNNQVVNKQLAKIAAGLRINSAADDAAGLAVAESLTTQYRGFDVATRNIQDFTSLAQTAEAGLSGIGDMTQRVRELSVQAANGTLTTEDRQLIQGEIDQLTQEIDRQAGSVEFNGQKLLDGSFNGTAQSGANSGDTVGLNISSVNSASLGLSGIDVTTQAGAQNAIGSATTAVNSLSTERASVGATINRLQSSENFSRIASENTLAAESRIRDADLAQELIGLTSAQIGQEAGTFGLAQSNINRQNVARLLGA